MKLSDIQAVSALNFAMRNTQEQIEAIDSASYKKGAMVTLWDKDSLNQFSFTVDLDDAFSESLKQALAERIESIKEQIKTYGVEV